MKVLGNELFLGATFEGESARNGEIVYGFAVIYKDSQIAYLITCFNDEMCKSNNKGIVYYTPVKCSTIKQIINSKKIHVLGEKIENENIIINKKEIFNSEIKYQGISITNNEIIEGIAAFKINDNLSIIITDFMTNDFSNGKPGICIYYKVKTDSLQCINNYKVKKHINS